MSNRAMLLLALIFASVWAAFWIYFVLASAWTEPGSFATKALVSVVGVGLFLISALVPLASPRAGGALLLVEGLALVVLNFTLFHNPPQTRAFLLMTLALPPLASGCLLLLANTRPHNVTG